MGTYAESPLTLKVLELLMPASGAFDCHFHGMYRLRVPSSLDALDKFFSNLWRERNYSLNLRRKITTT